MTTVLLDLDARGNLLDPANTQPVSAAAVPEFLRRRLAIPSDATDINVFVHGWMTSPQVAERNAHNLISVIHARFEDSAASYAQLPSYHSYNVVLRWPSKGVYWRIRRRAHRMSTEGYAAAVIAQLLGYLNTERRPPQRGPGRLRTADGQYLHAIGHSFGGRFLCQAIQDSGPARPRTLAWDWTNQRHPYTVDSILIFQMAARPDVFAKDFRPLLTDAPINCPIVLTYSKADHATGIWHRIAERSPGIGHVGARSPADKVKNFRLRPVTEDYTRVDLEQRIVNIDASSCFTRGRLWLPQGAHSDIVHAESAHLHLTLAALAR